MAYRTEWSRVAAALFTLSGIDDPKKLAEMFGRDWRTVSAVVHGRKKGKLQKEISEALGISDDYPSGTCSIVLDAVVRCLNNLS